MNKCKKTLVVISNQNMLSQFEWYHSMHQSDKCDAIIVNYDSNQLLEIMKKRCQDSKQFKNIYVYDNLLSDKGVIAKVLLLLKYIMLNLFGKKQRYDLKLIENVTGETDYQKVIVPCNYITFCVAAINAFQEAEIICFEDGFSDYTEFVDKFRFISFEFTLKWLLAKLDVLNYNCETYRFAMKNDYRMVKYCSLPERMKYRGYKEIRELFKNREIANREKTFIEKYAHYDLVIFTTIFPWLNEQNAMYCYESFHGWLCQNYQYKSILIKKHPKDTYKYEWSDLEIDICDETISGEELIQILPECEIILCFSSALLFELQRNNKNYHILYYKNIDNRAYVESLNYISNTIQIEDKWIYLE